MSGVWGNTRQNRRRDRHILELPTHAMRGATTMSETETRLKKLPRFPLPADLPAGRWHLLVGGLVRRPLALSIEDLAGMAGAALVADFACEEGWRVPGLRWRGIPLRAVLELAGVAPEATHVGMRSGEYLSVLPLDGVGETEPLLAFELDGGPLPVEHGGPLRLVGATTACYESVKWVEAIELLQDATADTARAIAFGRLQSRAGAEAGERGER
jgi:DMSO/TMAO reductase YedYZ molybdopterin-dependent catalytic subunit